MVVLIALEYAEAIDFLAADRMDGNGDVCMIIGMEFSHL